jgi:phosphoglycolate phosphatase
MIGDRREDIAAGRENRIKTIGVTLGYGTKKEMIDTAPDYICDSPSEIQSTLIRIQ